jgi:hypothetical protein
MSDATFELQSTAVAKAYASQGDWVCQAINESGIEVPERFADMFAARVDPSKCKRVDFKSATDLAQHMERLEQARVWFLTYVPASFQPHSNIGY